VLALAAFVAVQVGVADQVPGAQLVGQNLATAVIAALTIMSTAKLVRHLFKWLSGGEPLISISNPFRATPAR
jgi:hypothetical protein